jgi:hypothetical protein
MNNIKQLFLFLLVIIVYVYLNYNYEFYILNNSNKNLYNKYYGKIKFNSIYNIDEKNRDLMLRSFINPYKYTTCSNIDGKEEGNKFPCEIYNMVYNDDLLIQNKLTTNNIYGSEVCCLSK